MAQKWLQNGLKLVEIELKKVSYWHKNRSKRSKKLENCFRKGPKMAQKMASKRSKMPSQSSKNDFKRVEKVLI